MLEYVRIQNFQKHASLRVDLSHLVTSICGRSDAGKSAVLRALGWACTNRPNGDAFVRDGSDLAKVSLKVDGHVVKRSRAKSRAGNSYRLDGQAMAAFGSDVPSSIAQLLNLGEVNFQGQHDVPYLLGDSAGSVGRQLNAIIDLGEVDGVLDYLRSRTRKTATQVEVCEARLAEATERVEALQSVEKLDEKLKRVEALAADVDSRGSKADLLRRMVEDGQRHVQTLNRASKGHLRGSNVLAAGEGYAKLTAQAGKLRALVGSAVEYGRAATGAVEQRAAVVYRMEAVEKRIKKCPTCGQVMK